MHPRTIEGRIPTITYEAPEGGWTDATACVGASLPGIRAKLISHGAVLLRGLHIVPPEVFAEIATIIGGPLEDGYQGPSPRAKLARGVYTASEVSSAVVVPEHAEMSYEPTMPRHLFFWCRAQAEVGGATTVIDGRRVLAALDRAKVQPLIDGGLRIRRRHARPSGLHDPFELRRWTGMFGLRDRDALRQRASELGFEAHFERDGSLTLEHEQPTLRAHPETNEWSWLNHLLVFHASTPTAILASAVQRERELRSLALYPIASAYRRLAPIVGREVATDVRLRDGRPIADEVVAHVREVVDREASLVSLRPGDLLVVDNHLSLHGRRPFRGRRDVVVAWSRARH